MTAPLIVMFLDYDEDDWMLLSGGSIAPSVLQRPAGWSR
jgi:hypothetical protein